MQKKNTTYEYANNNLTKITLPSGAKQTYTYDSYHNVSTATSPEGMVSSFTYDTYGNNTKVTVGGSSQTQKISATATYTSDGNQLASVTDALGNTTAYGYDTQKGVLNWVQAPGQTVPHHRGQPGQRPGGVHLLRGAAGCHLLCLGDGVQLRLWRLRPGEQRAGGPADAD